MAVVNKFNVNREQVTLDADIIENMSANDVSYNSSLQYDENTVGDKLSELESEINGNSQVVITPNIGNNIVAEIDVKQGDVISVSAVASTPLTYSSYIILYMGDENIYRSVIIKSNNTTGSIPLYAVKNSGRVKVSFEYNEYAQNSIIFTIEPSKKGIIGSISEIKESIEEINDKFDASNSLWDKLTTPEIKDTIRTLNIKRSSYDSRITGIYLLSVNNVLHLSARIPKEYLWDAIIQMSSISANNIVYDFKVISTKIPSISIGEVVAQIVFADYETLLENITSGLDNSINVLVAMREITSTNIIGIDDVPTVNSVNVVSSNGVANAISNINIEGLKTNFLQLDENSDIIDKTKCVEHFLVAGGSDGLLKEFPANDFWATDFIPLKDETQYFFYKISVGWFCFYDEHKNRIYGVNTANSITELSNPFTTPAGTTYGRFSFASTSDKNVGWLSRSAYPNGEYGYISNGKLKITQNEVLNILYHTTTDKLPNLTKTPLEVIRFDCGVVPMIRTWGVIGASRNSGEFAGYEVGSSSISRVDDYQYSRLQQMCRLCGSEGYNFSVGGQTVKMWMLDTTSQRGFAHASIPENLKQAYIIDLGGNDVAHLDIYSMGLGSVADVNIYDYENNADSFAGWYGKLIQKMKEINPYARFFCETQPYGEQTYGAINQIIRNVAALFDNVYLMDMATYNPFGNYSALQRLNDHGSPLGYLYNAYEEMNYIDWIIRNNYRDFSDICFIGTTKRAFISYSISGNIVNGSKARVSLVNDNCQFYTTGNDSGQYEIIGIKPGIYQLTIAKSGYTSYTESVEVVDQNISKNITL